MIGAKTAAIFGLAGVVVTASSDAIVSEALPQSDRRTAPFLFSDKTSDVEDPTKEAATGERRLEEAAQMNEYDKAIERAEQYCLSGELWPEAGKSIVDFNCGVGKNFMCMTPDKVEQKANDGTCSEGSPICTIGNANYPLWTLCLAVKGGDDLWEHNGYLGTCENTGPEIHVSHAWKAIMEPDTAVKQTILEQAALVCEMGGVSEGVECGSTHVFCDKDNQRTPKEECSAGFCIEDVEEEGEQTDASKNEEGPKIVNVFRTTSDGKKFFNPVLGQCTRTDTKGKDLFAWDTAAAKAKALSEDEFVAA